MEEIEDPKMPATPAGATAKSRPRLMPVVVAALMLMEGVAIFVVAKLFFLPEPATARGAATSDATESSGSPAIDEWVTTAEIDITECRPNNSLTGRLVTFKMRVSALVAKGEAERAAALVTANGARITDRVNFVIRSAEPQHLNEPGLETVKRRIKHELGRILGDERLIREVLVPELIASGPGL